MALNPEDPPRDENVDILIITVLMVPMAKGIHR